MFKGRERRLHIQRPSKIATVPYRHKTLSSDGTLENQAYLRQSGRLKIKAASNKQFYDEFGARDHIDSCESRFN